MTRRAAAYVILNHRDGDQIHRLVRAILASSPQSQVFVTHDARAAAPPTFGDGRVHVRNHGLATDWGSWELVLATLEAFAWAREVADPALVVLISGQDYPVVRLEEWEQRVVASGGWGGEARPLAYRARWGRRHGEGDDDLTRYTYRWFRVRPTGLARHLPRSVVARFERSRPALAHVLEPAVGIRFVARGRGTHVGVRRVRNPFTSQHPCVKGSQWVAITRDLLDYLLAEAGEGSRWRRYFRHTVIPDEALIPTLLWWVRRPEESGPVTYVDWSAELDAPRTLTLEDLPAILASGAAFCRKVDPELSAGLLDALDAAAGVTAS